MPVRNEIKTLDLEGFVLGLNKDADPFQLTPQESPDALNVDFGLRGEVSKRMGYSRFDSPPTAENFHHFGIWEEQGGATHKIAVADGNGSVYHGTATALTDSTFDLGTTSGEINYHIGMASLNNKVYLTSLRTGSILSWDGTTWTSITAANFAGVANRFPRSRQVVTKHDRIFAANVRSSGGTNFRSRVYWSDPLDAETWQSNSFIDFDPDDGSEIKAMVGFGEDLVIFKDHSVQLLAGRSEESFTRFVLDSQLGTVSPYAVVPMGDLLIFFDRDHGVWGFDGAGFRSLDERINNYLLDGINYGDAYKAKAFVRRSKLYLSVPWGADAYNSRTFVFDRRTESWTEYDYGVMGAADDAGVYLAVNNRNAEGIYQLFTTNDDNGVAVDAYFYTPWMVPEGPETKSRVRRLDTTWSAKGDFDIDVTMYRDFFNSGAYRQQVINTDPGGSLWGTFQWGVDDWGGSTEQIHSRTTGWGQRFRSVQWRFGVNGLGEDFQLNRATIHISSLNRVRGEA